MNWWKELSNGSRNWIIVGSIVVLVILICSLTCTGCFGLAAVTTPPVEGK